MASPLNTFKTVTDEVTSSESTVYTAPSNITTIILMAQATNVSSNTATVTFSHYDSSSNTTTELVKDYDIPANDASGLITGKLVIETGDSVKISSGTDGSVKITLSLLETVNA